MMTVGTEARRLRAVSNVVAGFVAALVAAALPAGSFAQSPTYPEKPVRIIVPFAPAGPTDVVARLIATKLSERLGKQFYIENVTGAGGNTGMGQAARATPDGYTILFVSSSYVVNPSLYPKVPYDPYKDFIPVTVAGDAPNILLVHPSVPARTVSELVGYIRANPGKVSYASAGTGTTPHLSGELFRLSMKLDIVHVPFSGAGPAIQSIAGGHTPMAFTSLPPAIPLIQDGKIRPLAVSAEKRVAALPNVPTLGESGLPDQEADTLQAVLVPAGTPRPIVEFLYREIKAIVALPDIKERFAVLGLEPVTNTPEEFAAQIKKEIAKWSKVIHDANIKME
jgi:tripartite-type tricarboxylate transporter receptor subunit TctC